MNQKPSKPGQVLIVFAYHSNCQFRKEMFWGLVVERAPYYTVCNVESVRKSLLQVFFNSL